MTSFDLVHGEYSASMRLEKEGFKFHVRSERGEPINCWIWSLDSNWWDDNACFTVLTDEERIYSNQFSFASDKTAYIRHHAMKRLLLGRVTGVRPDRLSILRGNFGKPYLQDFPRLDFNLSHSGNLGGLVLGYGVKVGFDIESTEGGNFEAVAKRFFPMEAKQLEPAIGEADTRKFVRAWTAKEAYLKAVGRGLQKSLNSFFLKVDSQGRSEQLLYCADFPEIRERCRFFSVPIEKEAEYVATIVMIALPFSEKRDPTQCKQEMNARGS